MNLLLLGGTAEARALVAPLLAAGHRPTYSLAGRSPAPPLLPCPVRRGDFGHWWDLVAYLTAAGLEGVIDATHPHAARISQQAARACAHLGLPLWRWQRPPWRPRPGDRWQRFSHPTPLLAALAPYRRILFTVGASAYAWWPWRGPGQTWFVRALRPPPRRRPGLHPLLQRGPFALAQERRLLRRLRPEALVSKESGGPHVAAKLRAARELGLPVLLLRPPPAPAYGQPVASLAALLAALARHEASGP